MQQIHMSAQFLVPMAVCRLGAFYNGGGGGGGETAGESHWLLGLPAIPALAMKQYDVK